MSYRRWSLLAMILAPAISQAQSRPRSTVTIPIRKEHPDTVHDTVRVVRVDTVHLTIFQSVLHTDTLVRVDTVRDSCSRAIIPIPIPIPLPRRGHGGTEAAAIVTPEPSTWILTGTGLVVLLVASWFRNRKEEK